MAQQKVVAYVVQTNTVGNQAFGGVLGMDFDVDNPILITRLGVFDDSSDGLKLPITARLYDRSTQTELAALEFTPEDAGELIDGSRFKALTTPLRLEIGFLGTITAEGYGAEERLRNTLNQATNVAWTTQDGGGSIRFVGTSRYGVDVGMFPGTADEGPAARYAAGTFEFQTTPALLPGTPAVSLKPGDTQIVVSWGAVTNPLPAAKYQVLRAATESGALAQIAEMTGTSYTDSGLANGVTLYYSVRAISASGKAGSNSVVRSSTPYVLAASHYVAYSTPAGTLGSQAFGGSLGMDFDVENPILVKRLGVFDDGSDGLKLPITARIINRETQEFLAELSFTPEDPGVQIEGMRFKPLAQVLRLEAGFKGIIEADGYGAEERLRNSGGNTNAITWTLFDGNGSLKFVGTSRYGVTAGTFPDVADGGPAARYAAGTFEFEALPPERPAAPSVTVLRPAEDAAATLSWPAVTTPLPAEKYQVLRSTDPAGTFQQVAEVTLPTYRDTGLVNGQAVYYIVRAVGTGGKTSRDSAIVTTTPAPRRAGVAYVNPAGEPGNQAFDGSLGLDFDVAHTIRVTRLGVFDDGADGLNRTITAVLYDRSTRSALASLEFTPESPGELVDGSRFKNLPQPITLLPGFQGTMAASGYGEGESLFNTGGRVDDVAKLVAFDGGSLLFVGSGRYGAAGAYPDGPDGGPANRYAAGTFYFEPLADPPVMTVQPSGAKLRITWTGTGTLESAAAVTGPWQAVAGATSGVEVSPDEAQRFYRIKQ